MLIRRSSFGMMSEQEPCTVDSGARGMMIRRRSKDWNQPCATGTNSMGGGSGIRNSEGRGTACHASGNDSLVLTTQTISSSMSSSIHNKGSPQFRELIEMLLYCYLEYGGSQRSEQFRNLVEVFLCPVFEHVNRPSVSNSSSTMMTSTPPLGSTSTTTCITAVATPVPIMPCSEGDVASSCRSSSSSCTSSLPSTCTSPATTVVFTQGGGHADSASKNINMKSGCNVDTKGDEDGNLRCPACFGILIEPVTVQCGHSYCKKCLQKEVAGHSCRRCSHVITIAEAAHCKTNVLLEALVEKWWPEHITATRLRNEGNKMFEAKMVDKALIKYTQALALVPDDHLSLGNRSNCLLTAGRSEEALEDADAAIKCCPIWPKGYFRKSAAMISLGRYEEAFLSLTVCMYLMKLSSPKKSSSSSLASNPEDPARTQVINEMIKILQKIFLQSASIAVGSTLKRHNMNTELNIQYTPYPGARRRGGGGVAAFNRQDWNDSSEYNSSGDESDHVIQTHHHQHTWKSNRNPHRQHREQTHHRSSSSSIMVEQLSLRMTRLFNRAGQDLKNFENRLKGSGSQALKTIPRVVAPKDVSCSDLECSLCYRLLFQPVSTECGHTFCRSCLDRCMDHNPACPLCKTGLQSYLACREHAVTEFLEAAIKTFLPKEYEERLNQHMEELNSVAHTEGKNLDVDIPIFVCTMAFPTIPCPLHVFEPRYRLMIRRCMENGSNRFGMCCYLSEGENNYGDIGTLLEIRNIQYFIDGRSVVDTVGCRRFKVLHKNIVDGYNAARIELLHDKPVPENELSALNELHDKVLNEATGWLQSIGQVRRQRIHSHFGQMPAPEQDWIGSPDGPSWTWWLLAILPLDSKAQLAILSMCSLQKRLECILKVLNFVKNRMGSIGE